MASPQRCPKCGGPLLADAVAGQCPACLMGVANGPAAEVACRENGPFKERHFGDYVLGQQIGSGGMGVVYEAHQVSLNRKVALKFIRDSQLASPTLLRRFTIEAEATARLQHPGIVAIYAIGEVDGHPYYSMDLIEGESLRTAMMRGRFVLRVDQGSKTNGRSRQVEIARLIAKTARAVHHAHQRGVLHRDLKPANILLDRQGEPHLTDFGLAKILRETTEEGSELQLTPKSEIAGTAFYMAPEQATGDDVTSAADVYGLGAVLYELLTGQQLFKAATLFETLKQLQEEPPRRPRLTNPFVDRDLETICLKCLEKNPTYRYATAEALAEDLERWIEHKPIRAAPPKLMVRTRRWIKRNPAGTALIAALCLGLSGALILLMIVDRQRQKFELQQALLFSEKVEQLLRDWDNPNLGSLLISSKDLAILDNRAPVEVPGARRLSLGAVVHGDPISYVAQLAPMFLKLESTLGWNLSRSVQLDFVAIKASMTQFPVSQGTIDLMMMEATDYLLLKKQNPGISVFARIDREAEGAIIASWRSGVTNLQQLAGKAIAFPSPSEPLTIWGKARLTDAGVFRKDFRTVTNLDDSADQVRRGRFATLSRTRGREVIGAVLQNQVDATIAYMRRYELEKHLGLALLDSFVSTPKVFVARAGLQSDVIVAFRSALTELKRPIPDQHPNPSAFDWGETFPGAIPIDDSYLTGLGEAMRKAARFDGEPDPFPSGSSPRADGQK